MLNRIAFADESGLDGVSPCYGIGVVSLSEEWRGQFDEYFSSKSKSHGVVGEAKWAKISTSHGLINFGLNALQSIMRSRTASLDVMVVDKAYFRNWHSKHMTREDAFYQTFTILLTHIANRVGCPAKVYIDDRSDSYAKRDEMMQKIGNNMLCKIESSGRLGLLQKIGSHDCIGVQVADVLTGAITASHARKLNGNLPLNPGKRLAIERLAEVLGWDDLCYDTMPSPRINIWHFPPEYRAFPRTLPVSWSQAARYVSAADVHSYRVQREMEHNIVISSPTSFSKN